MSVLVPAQNSPPERQRTPSNLVVSGAIRVFLAAPEGLIVDPPMLAGTADHHTVKIADQFSAWLKLFGNSAGRPAPPILSILTGVRVTDPCGQLFLCFIRVCLPSHSFPVREMLKAPRVSFPKMDFR